jgi:hypothetical protein
MPNSPTGIMSQPPFRIGSTIILYSTLMAPSLCQALNFTSEVGFLAGYDDNINRKEDARSTASQFFSITPALAISGQASDDVTLQAGYQFTYTRYLADGLDSQLHQRGWIDFTTRLKPRLFLDLNGQIEALNNQENPDDDGAGISLSPGLIYHFSDRLSSRIDLSYSQWRYDSLNFDTGRKIILLEQRQVDNHYEVDLGFNYLLTLSTYLDLAYHVDYNESNNNLDEYNANSILASINTAIGNNLKATLGYNFGKWNYYNWRAGKMLRGKLRNDSQHRFWLSLEYSSTDHLDLLFNFDMTLNHSNLPYESFDRHLAYGGVRFNW